MTTSEIVFGAASMLLLGCCYCWLATLRGARKAYTWVGGDPSSYKWFWLRLFGIAPTENNCLRFLRVIGAAGAVVSILGAVAILVAARSG